MRWRTNGWKKDFSKSSGTEGKCLLWAQGEFGGLHNRPVAHPEDAAINMNGQFAVGFGGHFQNVFFQATLKKTFFTTQNFSRKSL